MAKETERKFLLKDDSFIAMSSHHVQILQGYLSRQTGRTVRVRIRDNEAFLTVKGNSNGVTRDEFEYPIPLNDALQMIGMCTGRIIAKTRYYVEYEGFTWEIDVFDGDLAPLVMAEIELPSAETPFNKPPFIGEEVTGNPKYYNSRM